MAVLPTIWLPGNSIIEPAARRPPAWPGTRVHAGSMSEFHDQIMVKGIELRAFGGLR
jgi:hypothetical protein